MFLPYTKNSSQTHCDVITFTTSCVLETSRKVERTQKKENNQRHTTNNESTSWLSHTCSNYLLGRFQGHFISTLPLFITVCHYHYQPHDDFILTNLPQLKPKAPMHLRARHTRLLFTIDYFSCCFM